ncbi:MAG: TetR/AcrR family transcriptional regulator [Pseudomonadota bacterium]
MTDSSLDPRRTRSRQKLRAALAQILGDRQLEEVSVDELTRAAGVSRPTFYSNYESVQGLMEECVSERLLAFKEVFAIEDADLSLKPIKRLERFLEQVLDVVESGDAITHYIFAGKGDPKVKAMSTRFTLEALKLRSESDVASTVSKESLALYATFYSGAVSNVISHLLEGSLGAKRDDLAPRLAKLIDGGIGDVLG